MLLQSLRVVFEITKYSRVTMFAMCSLYKKVLPVLSTMITWETPGKDYGFIYMAFRISKCYVSCFNGEFFVNNYSESAEYKTFNWHLLRLSPALLVKKRLLNFNHLQHCHQRIVLWTATLKRYLPAITFYLWFLFAWLFLIYTVLMAICWASGNLGLTRSCEETVQWKSWTHDNVAQGAWKHVLCVFVCWSCNSRA